MRQNQGKIGCLILAVMKAVPAPARFCERGARCFVEKFPLGLDEAAALFWRLDDWGINLQERDR